jgi:signal transduction histidine kinase/ActR/RegA family two-component response regulator
MTGLFDTEGFPPRWNCGTAWSADPWLGWLHIGSDLAIFGAYTAIPLVIGFFVLRRKDIPFPRIFWLFVIFIFACGTTHLVDSIIFWHPIYRFSGLVKLITAVASWSTVVALVLIAPEALRLPGLSKLNSELTREIEDRKQAETSLREREQQLRAKEAEREALLASERSARGESEKANRLKDEFLSVVSHELRTPLSSIMAYSQLMQAGALSGAELSEATAAIERNCKAQVKIIDDLLDMSQIISGKVRLDVRTIDPAGIIRSAVDIVRPAAEAKEIRLQTVLDPRAGPVSGDSDRLQQVLWNLLMNAVKFTPKGGRIQVVLARVNSHVEIRVSDSGQGIPADFLPYVFDRFRQAESTPNRRHGGLGLGLAIVKQLVELHGGSVVAESPGENLGSTITVNLPLQIHPTGEADREHPRAGGTSGVLQPPDLNGVRALVVDDEPDARDIVRQLLKFCHAEVATAASAEEALAMLGTFKPTVLISDIGMPGKDGYQFIQELRKNSTEFAALPALALTAFARTEDRRRAIMAGYQAHVTKPVDTGELLAVVAMLAGKTGVRPG